MKKIIYIFGFMIILAFAKFEVNAQIETGIKVDSWNTNNFSGSTGSIWDNRNIYIPKETIQKMFFVTTGNDQVHKYLRKYIISKLIENKFSKFASQPNFWWSSIYLNPPKTKTGSMNFDVVKNINQSDNLDDYINNYIYQYNNLTNEQKFNPSNFSDFLLIFDDYKFWSDIYMYKTEKDLRDMWYILTSYRTRINKDTEYRRYNIKTAFYYFGNVRVLNIWESIYYMNEINYDPAYEKNYLSWLSIVNDDEIPTYWWWLCGSSTAIYQWILSNKSIWVRSRSHSKRRTNLYAANINGINITTPWLDSTIYNSKYDLVITNKTDHPIVIISNFDGKNWWQEQNFTLWHASDIWDFDKAKKNQTVSKTTKTNKWKCYNRVINGKNKQSCYNEINNKEVK